MSRGWFSRVFRGDVTRIEALEREVGAMRSALTAIASQAPLEAERAQQASRSLDELAARVSSIEVRANADQELVHSAIEEVLKLKQCAEADHQELVRLRTGLLRVEREVEHSIEQAREAVTGLLQRIERVRLAQISGREVATADQNRNESSG